MELWSEIRRRVLVDGVSKREICREYKVGWRTVDKILEHAEPPGCSKKPRPPTSSAWQLSHEFSLIGRWICSAVANFA